MKLELGVGGRGEKEPGFSSSPIYPQANMLLEPVNLSTDTRHSLMNKACICWAQTFLSWQNCNVSCQSWGHLVPDHSTWLCPPLSLMVFSSVSTFLFIQATDEGFWLMNNFLKLVCFLLLDTVKGVWVSLEVDDGETPVSFKNVIRREEPRWRRNRTGRPLSLLQIHPKNNWTLNKVHKTTSDR